MAHHGYDTETLRGVVAFPFLLPDGEGERAVPGTVIEGETNWILRKVKDGHVNLKLPEDVPQVSANQSK
jgi:hypothetical protein